MKKILMLALVALVAMGSLDAQVRLRVGKGSPIEKLGRAEVAISHL